MMKPACLSLCLLAPLSAQAALPCDAYDDLVAQATMIMQIGDITLTRPARNDIICTLQGTVLRNFMGPHAAGTRIQTDIGCDGYPLLDGEVPEVSVGGLIYWDFNAVAATPVLELHISPYGGPAGHGAGILLLDAVTDAPQYRSYCSD